MTPDLDSELPAIVAGDADAFGRWVAGAEHELRRVLARFASFVDTEAVLQEGLLRTWQVAARCEGDGRPNAFLRFAVRLTRNLAIDELRRNRSSDAVIVELSRTAEDSYTVVAPDPFLREAVARCRAELRGQTAKALNARLDDAGAVVDHDLAKRVGMRLNTFLQNITRARKLLEICLRKRGVDVRLERT